MGSVDDTLGLIQQFQNSGNGPDTQQPQGPAASTLDMINKVQTGTMPPAIPTHEDVANIGAASNTRTGLAKGAGRLLEMMTPLAMVEQNIPQDMYKPGDVGQQSTNAFLGGQAPYQPQTGLGRVYQNTLSDTVASAPMAALGTGGLGALALRQGMNLTGNLGGEIGREALPNHPIIGGILGSLAGSTALPVAGGLLSSARNTVGKLVGTQGAVEREALSQFSQNPAYSMPMSDIDNTLSTQGGSYWTPARIAAQSELNKRQTVSNLLQQGAATAPPSAPPGLLSSIGNEIKQHPYFVAGTGGGLAGLGLLPGFGEWAFPAGVGLGEAATYLGRGVGNWIKNSRMPAFNRAVGDYLTNNPTGLYQAYQQQQQVPGIMSRLLSGYAAPVANDFSSSPF